MGGRRFLPVRAGIDEAGLGPLLGPLCLGWSAVEVRTPSADAWSAWKPLVAREIPKAKAKLASTLVVADSKKVFARNDRGRARLERTALCFLAQVLPGATPPGTLGELLDAPIAPLGPLARMGPQGPVALEPPQAPWYARRELPLARHVDLGGLELLAERLRRTIEASEVALVGAGLRAVPAEELNASYARTNNKGTTVLSLTFDALEHLWARFAARGLEVVVDRQGGRAHYDRALARRFPGAHIKTLEIRPGSSSYRLEEGEREMLVAFTEKGEDHSFATALGSCFAKFARETVMEAFNQHFLERDPDLKPTAGYTTDGRRFIQDAAKYVVEVEKHLVVRNR